MQEKYKAQSKYDKKNTKTYTLKLNLKSDEDILTRLSKEENIQGFIKSAIRKEIKPSK